jgi:hypothetical protein
VEHFSGRQIVEHIYKLDVITNVYDTKNYASKFIALHKYFGYLQSERDARSELELIYIRVGILLFVFRNLFMWTLWNYFEKGWRNRLYFIGRSGALEILDLAIVLPYQQLFSIEPFLCLLPAPKPRVLDYENKKAESSTLSSYIHRYKFECVQLAHISSFCPAQQLSMSQTVLNSLNSVPGAKKSTSMSIIFQNGDFEDKSILNSC